MSRITHLSVLPKNIEYWDYYILCRLNDSAAMALQRMEYWDGTKADGNVHGEQINDQITATGKKPTQDVSRFVYKSHDQLSWELMGTCSERAMPKMLDLILNDLMYLKWRSNPYNTFDRTKQYEFQEKLVQSHLNRLYEIVQHFREIGREESPVLYAIEQLTEEGFYVAQMERQEDGTVIEKDDAELLTIERVTTYLRLMHEQASIDEEESKKPREKGRYSPTLPRFIQLCLKKDTRNGFSSTSDVPNFPYGKNAVSSIPENVDSIQQNGGMDTAELPDGYGKKGGVITVTTTTTTGNDYEDKVEKNIANANSSLLQEKPAHSSPSSQEETLPQKKVKTPRKPTTPSRRRYNAPEPPVYTLEEHSVLEAWNALLDCPEDEDSQYVHDLIASLNRKIIQSKGKVSLADIKRVYDKIAADDFWKDKLTLKVFVERFSANLQGLNKPQNGTSSKVIVEDPDIRRNAQGDYVDRHGIVASTWGHDPVKTEEMNERNMRRMVAGIPPERRHLIPEEMRRYAPADFFPEQVQAANSNGQTIST